MTITSMKCLAAAFVVTATLAGCATGPTILTDQDPHANLQEYKTFGFYEPLDAKRSGYSRIVNAHLKQATREQLERLGYTYSDRAPDLRVNFIIGVRERVDVHSNGFGVRGLRNGGVETDHYRHGTLAIDLVDSKTRSLVWRGIAEGDLDEKATQQAGTLIGDVVTKVFGKFPTTSSTS